MDKESIASTDKQYLLNVGKRGTNGSEFKIEDADVYITMSPEIYTELNSYVQHYNTEVSGCGMVDEVRHEDGTIEYVVTEAYLPSKQDNTGSATDIDAEVVHSIMHDLLQAGKDTTKLKMHWHSHVNMSVFHSGTDEDNYSDLLQNDYLVSLVLNKAGELLGRIDIMAPFKITVSKLPVFIRVPLPQGKDSEQRVESNLKALDKYIEENKKTTWTYLNGEWNAQKREFGPPSKKNKRKAKKNKHNKHSKYIGTDWPNIDDMEMEDLANYIASEFSMYEQNAYEDCRYSIDNEANHTCYNPLRCIQYNRIMDKLLEDPDFIPGETGGGQIEYK